jgi:hypothetical protein
MTSIDVMKFANAETRHPHKEILKLLARHVDFDGDEPLHPTVPRAFIVGGDVRCDELERFSVARIERAIDSLVEAQVVEERTDFWSGRRTLGIRELLDAVDAPNETLREEVYRKAKSAGLWPKFRSSSGWQLVTGGDVTVCEGPISALNKYLDWQASHILR